MALVMPTTLYAPRPLRPTRQSLASVSSFGGSSIASPTGVSDRSSTPSWRASTLSGSSEDSWRGPLTPRGCAVVVLPPADEGCGDDWGRGGALQIDPGEETWWAGTTPTLRNPMVGRKSPVDHQVSLDDSPTVPDFLVLSGDDRPVPSSSKTSSISSARALQDVTMWSIAGQRPTRSETSDEVSALGLEVRDGIPRRIPVLIALDDRERTPPRRPTASDGQPLNALQYTSPPRRLSGDSVVSSGSAPPIPARISSRKAPAVPGRLSSLKPRRSHVSSDTSSTPTGSVPATAATLALPSFVPTRPAPRPPTLSQPPPPSLGPSTSSRPDPYSPIFSRLPVRIPSLEPPSRYASHPPPPPLNRLRSSSSTSSTKRPCTPAGLEIITEAPPDFDTSPNGNWALRPRPPSHRPHRSKSQPNIRTESDMTFRIKLKKSTSTNFRSGDEFNLDPTASWISKDMFPSTASKASTLKAKLSKVKEETVTGKTRESHKERQEKADNKGFFSMKKKERTRAPIYFLAEDFEGQPMPLRSVSDNAAIGTSSPAPSSSTMRSLSSKPSFFGRSSKQPPQIDLAFPSKLETSSPAIGLDSHAIPPPPSPPLPFASAATLATPRPIPRPAAAHRISVGKYNDTDSAKWAEDALLAVLEAEKWDWPRPPTRGQTRFNTPLNSEKRYMVPGLISTSISEDTLDWTPQTPESTTLGYGAEMAMGEGQKRKGRLERRRAIGIDEEEGMEETP